MTEENKTKEQEEQKKEEYVPKKINWFRDCEVYYLPSDKQREVLLNPGYEKEIFRKAYKTGEVVLKKRYYISELPARRKGKIIAVTAVPKHKNLFRDKYKDHRPYKELSTMGVLKPKPIGNYYELFEDELGWRVWTSPREYQPIRNNKNKKNRRRK